MKKMGFGKPKIKKTPVSKAFELPKGPKGPEAMHKTPSAPPFGRVKRTRGMFGAP